MLMEANKVMRKTLILMTVCAVAAVAAPRTSYAACGVSVPLSNLIGSSITGCPDGSPVSAYAYQIDDRLTNSGIIDIACEGLNAAVGCQQVLPVPNAPGDGNVTIETDWSTPGYNGCIAGHRVVIVVQCNDGSGVKLSLSGADGGFGYEVELAFPYDPDSGAVFPLDLKLPGGAPRFKNGRPEILGLTRAGGNDIYNVHVPAGDIQSDCTPGTLGEAVDAAFGSLNCAAFVPTLAPGKVYKSTQPCPSTCQSGPNAGQACSSSATCGGAPCVIGRPTTAGLVGWTEDTAPLDGSGNKSITMPTPPTGQCNFLGTTSNISGVDSGNIDGYVAAAPAGAASPVAEAVRAAKAGNSITVSFSTSSELGLAGFNILTGSKGKGELKLNAALVAARGIGGAGASYTLSFPMSEFKGGRNIIVESVLTNGTTLRAPQINF
jgi:hypothetical protein